MSDDEQRVEPGTDETGPEGGSEAEVPSEPEAATPVGPPVPPPAPPAPSAQAVVAPGPQVPAGPPPYWAGYYPPPPPPPQPPRRRSTLGLWIIAIVIVGGFFLIMMIGMIGALTGTSVPLTGEQVGVISITGVIQDGGRGGLFSGGPGSRGWMADIRSAYKDDNVKSVIILINSPGGSPAASHAIYEEITRLRTKKRVVACMTDVAASGGYYVAASCDRIVAQGSTLTGSIGVIFGGVGYYGLMQKLGLTDQTQTAGKYKDIGSGKRPMTAEEKAYLQALLQDVYGQFLKAVADGRKMDIAKVRRLAEGRIYTGAQAKKVGLVDELGNFYDAVKLAGKLGGIKGEPKVRYYGESGGLFGALSGSESSMFKHLAGRSLLQEPPTQGPMLLLPEVYQGFGL